MIGRSNAWHSRRHHLHRVRRRRLAAGPAAGRRGTPGGGGDRGHRALDLSAWPSGTRLVVRRGPLHAGAQHSLAPSTMFRYWAHYTDAAGDPVDLDLHMRAHIRVENNIRRLKDSRAHDSSSPTSTPTVSGSPSFASAMSSCVVPGALPLWGPGRRRAQDAALGALAHPGAHRAPGPAMRHAHSRRLVWHPRAARRLPAHCPAHLSPPLRRSTGTTLTTRAPTRPSTTRIALNGTAHDFIPAGMQAHPTTTGRTRQLGRAEVVL